MLNRIQAIKNNTTHQKDLQTLNIEEMKKFSSKPLQNQNQRPKTSHNFNRSTPNNRYRVGRDNQKQNHKVISVDLLNKNDELLMNAGADHDLRQAINKKYEVLQLIGKGGQGSVIKAKCRATQRLVALKFLANQCYNGTDYIRILREI